MLPIDPRYLQILCLSSFLFLGVATRDWTLQPMQVGVILLTCLITQVSCGYLLHIFRDRSASVLESSFDRFSFQISSIAQLLSSLPSALITGLGLSLLLRADHPSTLMLASVAAISSKFLLRLNEKHLFNPANFGIIVALILTQDAWVSPGQWGEEGWYALLFLSLGGLVVQAVGRWDTTIAFLVPYAGLEAVRNFWLGWSWDVWAHRLMSGSLLIFAFFMITDPRTIPNARWGRILWAGAIAFLTFILRNVYFLPTAAFWALFILTPFIFLIDRQLPAARFTWQPLNLIQLDHISHNLPNNSSLTHAPDSEAFVLGAAISSSQNSST